MNSYDRESKDLVPLDVKVTKNGVTTTVTNYSTALVEEGTRPSTWTAAVTLDGDTGLVLPGTATSPGRWDVFIKVTDTPLIPIVNLGQIALT